VWRTRTAVLAALLSLFLGLGLAVPALAGASPPTQATTTPTTAPPPPPPKSYVLVDANTGAVLAASADRDPRPPASLTKVLTALAASATLPHDGTLTISARAAAQPANKVGAKAGEVWPINDAMHVMLMQSANDLALAFAEAVGGTAEGFQEVLTRTSAAIGMQDSQTWNDPAGLDDEESVGGGNLVSARDLAIAGRAMIADPWLSPISAKPRYKFTAPDGVVHDATNHNKLVLGRYPGAIGGKTGYTKKSGNSLLASAQRNGRTMVAVVMDTKDAYGFTSSLFDRGFATRVEDQEGLERLPPLRLPTAAKIRPAAPPPSAPLSSLEPPVDGVADPTAASPELPSRAAPGPTPVEPVAAEGGEKSGLPLVAAGVAAVLVLGVGAGRGQVRRRRKRRYYQVPTRRAAP
jgi:D-alanyl-D-alanine carboxypeptidase